MSNPRPWSIGCLEWQIFRIPAPTRYVRDNQGKMVRITNNSDQILEWLTANVVGQWTWGGHYQGESRPIYIQDKGDALMFKLTWSDHLIKPVFK